MLMGIGGAVAACVVCFSQTDMKVFVAYLRVIHISLLFGVVFCYMSLGNLSVVVVSVRHAFVSGFFFYFVGSIYERVGSRSVIVIRGVAAYSYVKLILFTLMCFIGMGLPPFLGFWGEIGVNLTLLGGGFRGVLIVLLFIDGVIIFIMIARVGGEKYFRFSMVGSEVRVLVLRVILVILVGTLV